MTIRISTTAEQIVAKVLALREYTKSTGFKTTKSQNDLIQAVTNPDDLASIVLTLKQDQ